MKVPQTKDPLCFHPWYIKVVLLLARTCHLC